MEVGSVTDAAERIARARAHTGGLGPDMVIACSGFPDTFIEALRMVRVGGVVIEAGTFVDMGPVRINPNSDICTKNVSVLGIGGETANSYLPSMRLMAANLARLPFDRIVTHRMPLERAQEAGGTGANGCRHENRYCSEWCPLMAKLRVGVIGCGLIAQVMHLHYLRELDEIYEIAALCDVSEDLRTACARDYGVGATFGDWRELIAAPLDAVFILTSGSHAPIAITAAEAGLHVLTEKPMCFSVAEGRAMIEAAERAGVALMVAYNKRYDPAYRRCVEEVRGLKDIRLARVTTLESPFQPYVAHYRLHKPDPLPADLAARFAADNQARITAAIGEADPLSRRAYHLVLLDSMVHEFNAIRGLLGEPDRLEFSDIRENGLTAILRFGDTQCVITWVDLPGIARYQMDFSLYTPQRRVTLAFPSPFLRSAPTLLTVEGGDDASPRAWATEEVSAYAESFKQELVHFHDCVTAGRDAGDVGARRAARHRAVRGGGRGASHAHAALSSDRHHMTAAFRLGLIGAGRMGRTHLRALAASERVRVVAVAEPVAAIRAELDAPGLALHAELDAMLRAGGLDGVLVVAPSTRHLDVVTRVAAARLPILCEKPCGVTSAQAAQAAGIAAAAGIPLQVAYWRRYVPALRRLHDRIAVGELGKIYFVACYQWDAAPPSPAFRANSGGIFVDMGVHEFDQIRWLTGQEFSSIHSVAAGVGTETLAAGHPENAQALCTLSGGSTALVSLGQSFPKGDVCFVEAFGTRDAEDVRFLWPPDADAVFLDALRRQAEAFADHVGGRPTDGATAFDAVAALRAAEQAAE